MRNIVKIILILFTGLIIGFSLGRIFNSETLPSDYVRVTVKNNSGYKLKSLILQHKNGDLSLKNLGKDEIESFYFKNGGEGFYLIKAVFENNSEVISKPEYIEGGYKNIQILHCDHFEVDRNG